MATTSWRQPCRRRLSFFGHLCPHGGGRHVDLSKVHHLAVARPKLNGHGLSSTVPNQVCLGLPSLWEDPKCRPEELENGLVWCQHDKGGERQTTGAVDRYYLTGVADPYVTELRH